MSVLDDVMNDKSIIHGAKRIYKYIQSHMNEIGQLTESIYSDLKTSFPDSIKEDNIIKIPVTKNDSVDNIETAVNNCISKHFNDKLQDAVVSWDHFYNVYVGENNICVGIKI